jgi:hypothetical protein
MITTAVVRGLERPEERPDPAASYLVWHFIRRWDRWAAFASFDGPDGLRQALRYRHRSGGLILRSGEEPPQWSPGNLDVVKVCHANL